MLLQLIFQGAEFGSAHIGIQKQEGNHFDPMGMADALCRLQQRLYLFS
jgi:hypothetical protein